MIVGPLLITAALVTRQALAPSPDHRRAYAYGSVLLSHHPANGVPYHRVAARLGGNAWTIGGGGGGWLNPSVGLEGEVVFGGTVSAPQRFSYFSSEDYIARNRDLLITELVRLRTNARSRVHVVAGGGYAMTRAQNVSRVVTDSFGRKTSIPDGQATTLHALSLTAGVDMIAAVSPRVALSPTFRVRWVRRPTTGSAGWNGIGASSFQFGAAVHLR